VLGAHQFHGVRQEFVDRLRALVKADPEEPLPASTPAVVSRLRRESLVAQREKLLELRGSEVIGDDVFHRLQHELDLEEMRAGR